LHNVQRGILSAFDRDGATITHGALLSVEALNPPIPTRPGLITSVFALASGSR